ncbi:flagella basal body P-ring formation protein FlgA [Bordetella trematum]|nr:flagella basal body P-ring formation protein FlgA [Bordetella trematum]
MRVHAALLSLCLTASPAFGQAMQSPEAVAQAAEALLAGELAALSPEASIAIEAARVDRLPACHQPQAFLPANARLRPRMSVGVRCTAPQSWSTYVQATLSAPGQYYVASRALAPGMTLGPDDMQARDGDLLTLPSGALTDPTRILGMQTRQRVGAGQTLREQALRSPHTVLRGQSVRLVARGQGFTVTSEGQALHDAEPGAMLQVRTVSGQVINGQVQAAGEVEVAL